MLLNEDFVFNVHAFRDATRIAALPDVYKRQEYPGKHAEFFVNLA